MRCPNCNEEVDEAATECPFCDEPLEIRISSTDVKDSTDILDSTDIADSTDIFDSTDF